MNNLPDFKEGVNICETNSMRLSTSARIIINNKEHGTNSFGLYLLYMSYEEIAKAIFCFFIDKGWVKYEFVKDVFKKHQAKVFLFEEFFSSFSLNDGVVYLGGKKLGEISLDEFIKKYQSEIQQHRIDTMKFLYVEPDGNKWHIPYESITDIKEKEENIVNKITALRSVLRTLQQNSNRTLLNNFKIIQNSGGFIQMQYDSI